MNWSQATAMLQGAFARMDGHYGKPVFDEWVLITFNDNNGHILHYNGPRKEGFIKSFSSDVKMLLTQLSGVEHHLGDFEFVRQGSGTLFDAYMVVGDRVYLICNHTGETMDNITRDPRWLSAQVPFVELTDKFRHDPLISDY